MVLNVVIRAFFENAELLIQEQRGSDRPQIKNFKGQDLKPEILGTCILKLAEVPKASANQQMNDFSAFPRVQGHTSAENVHSL